jgi:nitrogen fixation/metabolism regulation signal transduction histidine kinase
MAWREMARQVAHEIKNPLTPMKLSVQHMRRAFQRLRVPEPQGAPGEDDDVQRFSALFDRITNTLIEQINTLARIANEFSSFARLPERDVEVLDLNDVIREAAALMQEEAEATIELTLHAAPLTVQADREELRRIYINLIKNAMQAIPRDREGHIHVATGLDAETLDAAERVQSRVSDNGVGIPPEQHTKIFQPNFSTKTSGTGLGLAIAQKTVRDLGGEIGFRTEPGEGTTFWIDLPVADA